MLTKVFELNSVPNLTHLNLSNNSIQKISYEDFKPVKLKIETVLLDRNEINFDTLKVFCYFFEIPFIYSSPFRETYKYMQVKSIR